MSKVVVFFVGAMVILFGVRTNVWADETCNIPLTTKIGHALVSGKKVLLVAWEAGQACGDDDEACGDWADGLNKYAGIHKNTVEVIMIPPTRWAKVVHVDVDKVSLQSTLFMKKSEDSFFYADPIVEPQIYTYVEKMWSLEPFAKNYSGDAPKRIHADLCKP